MRVKLLLSRFLRRAGKPSLVETLLMTLALSLAGWAYFISLIITDTRRYFDTQFQGYWSPSMYGETEAILWLGWVTLYALPLVNTFLAASFTLAEVEREGHELLRLTQISPTELLTGYTLAAAYRQRVSLILPLSLLLPLGAAMAYWCYDSFDLLDSYSLRLAVFDTLLGMEMAFVAWTVNLFGVCAGAGAALWRKHRAQAVALALGATIIVELALTAFGMGSAMVYIYPYF